MIRHPYPYISRTWYVRLYLHCVLITKECWPQIAKHQEALDPVRREIFVGLKSAVPIGTYRFLFRRSRR